MQGIFGLLLITKGRTRDHQKYVTGDPISVQWRMHLETIRLLQLLVSIKQLIQGLSGVNWAVSS